MTSRMVNRIGIAAISAFALAALAADAPEGWLPLKINEKKKPTIYELATEGGKPVLHARADASASGAYKKADFTLADRPMASWSWKVSRLIDKADNSRGAREDSPARIVLAFDGDKATLPRSDQAVLRMAHKLSGQNLPYATLMYIWSKDLPVGTIVANPHTRRIQMIVASSGAASVGAWQNITRDVADDYRRAFNQEAGKLLAYGVMSDTDNTGESVEAWYGEIAFTPRP